MWVFVWVWVDMGVSVYVHVGEFDCICESKVTCIVQACALMSKMSKVGLLYYFVG